MGKDVRQWFEPNTAAGAIKCVNVVIACRLNVDTCSDLWSNASQKHRSASWSQSMARSSKRMSTGITSAHPISSSPKLSRWGGRGIVVLIGIRLGIDSVNPVYYDTIKVCDPFLFFHVHSIGIHQGVVHTPIISWHSRRLSIVLVGSQADNMFYLDPHHTHQTIPLRPPKQTSKRGISDQPSHARVGVCVTPWPSSFACVQSHRLIYPTASHRPYQSNCQ